MNGTALIAANFATLLVDTRWDQGATMRAANLKSCTVLVDGVQFSGN